MNRMSEGNTFYGRKAEITSTVDPEIGYIAYIGIATLSWISDLFLLYPPTPARPPRSRRLLA